MKPISRNMNKSNGKLIIMSIASARGYLPASACRERAANIQHIPMVPPSPSNFASSSTMDMSMTLHDESSNDDDDEDGQFHSSSSTSSPINNHHHKPVLTKVSPRALSDDEDEGESAATSHSIMQSRRRRKHNPSANSKPTSLSTKPAGTNSTAVEVGEELESKSSSTILSSSTVKSTTIDSFSASSSKKEDDEDFFNDDSAETTTATSALPSSSSVKKNPVPVTITTQAPDDEEEDDAISTSIAQKAKTRLKRITAKKASATTTPSGSSSTVAVPAAAAELLSHEVDLHDANIVSRSTNLSTESSLSSAAIIVSSDSAVNLSSAAVDHGHDNHDNHDIDDGIAINSVIAQESLPFTSSMVDPGKDEDTLDSRFFDEDDDNVDDHRLDEPALDTQKSQSMRDHDDDPDIVVNCSSIEDSLPITSSELDHQEDEQFDSRLFDEDDDINDLVNHQQDEPLVGPEKSLETQKADENTNCERVVRETSVDDDSDIALSLPRDHPQNVNPTNDEINMQIDSSHISQAETTIVDSIGDDSEEQTPGITLANDREIAASETSSTSVADFARLKSSIVDDDDEKEEIHQTNKSSERERRRNRTSAVNSSSVISSVIKSESTITTSSTKAPDKGISAQAKLAIQAAMQSWIVEDEEGEVVVSTKKSKSKKSKSKSKKVKEREVVYDDFDSETDV
jgi:hypothetical protein